MGDRPALGAIGSPPPDVRVGFKFIENIGESANSARGNEWSRPLNIGKTNRPELGCKWIVDFEADSFMHRKTRKGKQVAATGQQFSNQEVKTII